MFAFQAPLPPDTTCRAVPEERSNDVWGSAAGSSGVNFHRENSLRLLQAMQDSPVNTGDCRQGPCRCAPG